MTENGRLNEVLKTREIIDELKLECSGCEYVIPRGYGLPDVRVSPASQVITMLREKLQSVGSELVEAKTRSSELEGLQSADREALRTSSTNLSSASEYKLVIGVCRANGLIGEQIGRLAEELKNQQAELNKALLLAADFESKLNDANTRYVASHMWVSAPLSHGY